MSHSRTFLGHDSKTAITTFNGTVEFRPAVTVTCASYCDSLAPPLGFEPRTYRLTADCYCRLSYEGLHYLENKRTRRYRYRRYLELFDTSDRPSGNSIRTHVLRRHFIIILSDVTSWREQRRWWGVRNICMCSCSNRITVTDDPGASFRITVKHNNPGADGGI